MLCVVLILYLIGNCLRNWQQMARNLQTCLCILQAMLVGFWYCKWLYQWFWLHLVHGINMQGTLCFLKDRSLSWMILHDLLSHSNHGGTMPRKKWHVHKRWWVPTGTRRCFNNKWWSYGMGNNNDTEDMHLINNAAWLYGRCHSTIMHAPMYKIPIMQLLLQLLWPSFSLYLYAQIISHLWLLLSHLILYNGPQCPPWGEYHTREDDKLVGLP